MRFIFPVSYWQTRSVWAGIQMVTRSPLGVMCVRL
jgi:hypothetical protein